VDALAADLRAYLAGYPVSARANLQAQLKRIETTRYLASVYYWPFNRSLGQYAKARPIIEGLDREMDALLQSRPGQTEVMEHYGGLLNQLSDFQRIAGEFGASLATQRKSHRIATQLLATAGTNPRWQRWLYLAEGRLADALLETGDTAAGIAMWESSIQRRQQVAAADPGNERAQRNLANGYGPLAEAVQHWTGIAEALAWYRSARTALLRDLRARQFPQVKALPSAGSTRVGPRPGVASALLNGRHRRGAAPCMRALDAGRADDLAQALDPTPTRPSSALVRAQVLLGVGGVAADGRERLLGRCRRWMRWRCWRQSAAHAEPFNVTAGARRWPGCLSHLGDRPCASAGCGGRGPRRPGCQHLHRVVPADAGVGDALAVAPASPGRPCRG
jgi:hypothetical protein